MIAPVSRSQPGTREVLPWWAYVLMLPLALPGIVLVGWIIETIAEMNQP